MDVTVLLKLIRENLGLSLKLFDNPGQLVLSNQQNKLLLGTFASTVCNQGIITLVVHGYDSDSKPSDTK